MHSVLSSNVNNSFLTEYSGTLYAPPTNKASSTSYAALLNTPTVAAGVVSLPSFPASSVPFLPVSKGSIKKLAQTRFVNSSPKSYRPMPASVESSVADRTSFVEKTSQKFILPVSYFLEVAKLWEISNRSELECHFTLANSNEHFKTTTSLLPPDEQNGDKPRPICHTKPAEANLWGSPGNKRKRQKTENSAQAEKDLLQSVNRFLRSCRNKDKCSTISPDIINASTNVGSETRRYLSQIVTLMSKKFAAQLVRQQSDLDSSGKGSVSNVQMEKLNQLNQLCLGVDDHDHVNKSCDKLQAISAMNDHEEVSLKQENVGNVSENKNCSDHVNTLRDIDEHDSSQSHEKILESPNQEICEISSTCSRKTEELTDQQVKIISMSSENDVANGNDHLLIIHIPNLQKNHVNKRTEHDDEHSGETVNKRRRTQSEQAQESSDCSMGGQPSLTAGSTESKYKCFYCTVRYEKRIDCARHMLSHLPVPGS